MYARCWRTVVVTAVFGWACGVLAPGCGGDARSDIKGKPDTRFEYRLARVFEVEGRQGIATDGKRYYVSDSAALYVYSKQGEVLAANKEPFENLEKPANHIGDISVYDGELYAESYRWNSAETCVAAMIRLCARYARMARNIGTATV